MPCLQPLILTDLHNPVASQRRRPVAGPRIVGNSTLLKPSDPPASHASERPQRLALPPSGAELARSLRRQAPTHCLNGHPLTYPKVIVAHWPPPAAEQEEAQDRGKDERPAELVVSGTLEVATLPGPTPGLSGMISVRS
jgi:hypothetical protein